MNKEYKYCRDCKWLKGKKSSVGIECLQPDNQAKWEKQRQRLIERNAFCTNVVAKYKPLSQRACKRFEEEEKKIDAEVL